MTPSSTHTDSALHTAQQLLLVPGQLQQNQLEQVLESICSSGVDDADLYFQYTRSEGWSLEEGMVKSGSFSIDQGVGVRAVSGEKTAFAYSGDITLAALRNAAGTVRSIGSMGQSARVQLGADTAQAVAPTAYWHSVAQAAPARGLSYPVLDPIATQGSAEKVALLQRMDQWARAADPRICQVMASVAAEYDVVLLARADRHWAADVRPLVRVSISVIAEQNGRRETGSGGGGGRWGLDELTDSQIQQWVRQAVLAALTNLEARPAPAGEMSVVLGPGWPGVMLHEAVGHGLEGDFNRKGSSAFSGMVGRQVASKGVTVVDDGTLPGRRGSLNVDDEGHPTQATVLIEDGILRGYLQDRLNARLMGVAVTGNGRRESYAAVPLPRMTNTYMRSGTMEPEEIISSLKRGVYATNFGGGQVDITCGKFVFSASEAWWVEDGKICYPIKGATLIGNGPQAMQHVSMIGNDMALDSGVGTCGKDGQSVPVGVGQPTLRIEGLVVGGTA